MLSTDIEQYQLYDKQSGQKFIPELTSLLNEFSKSNDKLAENYKDINFEDLLSYVSYIVDYYYRNKIELTIKHRDNTFYLNQSLNSLNQILKYLANVKN